MATDNDKSGKSTPDTGQQKSLNAHKEPQKLASHPQAHALRAHSDDDDIIVPAVTADVDETPKAVKYGAAVILGLAFGLGCYIWVDGGVPKAESSDTRIAAHPTEAYFNQPGLYDDPSVSGTIPDPFVSPFEPTLQTGSSSASADLRTAALAESVAPVAETGPDAPSPEASEAYPPVGTQLVYLFAYDSSSVPESAELNKLAQIVSRSGLSLDVKAYTDEHGRPAYNKRLSIQRAKAIADYLIAHGVPASKVKASGMGPTHAFANDANDRRAEITVVK